MRTQEYMAVICIADLAERYIITPAKQFKVNDILDGMTTVPITKAQQIVAKSDVDDIVFSECTEVAFWCTLILLVLQTGIYFAVNISYRRAAFQKVYENV